MRLQVLLHDESAHRMTDEHWRGTQLADNGVYVVHVIGNRTRFERLGQAAGTVAAKAQCDGAVTLIGEEVQKMLVPAPCCDASAVNEQQRNGVRIGGRSLIDHFQHGSVPPIKTAARNGK